MVVVDHRLFVAVGVFFLLAVDFATFASSPSAAAATFFTSDLGSETVSVSVSESELAFDEAVSYFGSRERRYGGLDAKAL